MRLKVGQSLRATRLGLRYTLLGLSCVWLVWLAVMTLGFRNSIRSLEEEFQADTARLLAREQANLVIERSVEALRRPDAASLRLLQSRVEDLTVLSEVVTSLAVVDKEGRVVASQPRGPSRLEAPAGALFGDPPRPRLESRGQSFLRRGDYVVSVPLVDGQELVGYLRMGVHSDRIAAFYLQGWGRLAALGGIGLLAAGALAALVQLQLSRHVAAITASLDDASQQEAARPGDEFARTLQQASRGKGELEQAQRQGEDRAEAIANLTQVGVVIAGRDLRVEHVSARGRELCGCADEAEFEQVWGQVLAPELRRALEQSAAGAEAAPSVVVEVRPGHSVRAEIHRSEGPAEEHLAVLSDPRALEAVEKDARLLGQIERLGRVYRTLAHELRAPLGAAMLNLETLQQQLGSGNGAGGGPLAQRCVGVLRNELGRLSRSLQGILTQTAPEASPVKFDLAGALSDLVAFLAPQARRQSVKVEVRVVDGPLPVHGYPDRLRQAFLNVAVNALEAMPRGGRLTVEVRRDGARARVALRDTGPGIPASVLPRVYDSDFTTKDGGSGIGLHVARAVVELHGGEIGVESQPGRGTDVLVHVPLAPGSP